MKHYVKVYLDYFGLDESDSFIPCEICGAIGIDIRHIRARGMGGTKDPKINRIENLMMLCRRCHLEYGDKKEHREFLETTHRKQLLKDSSKCKTEIERYL